MRTDSSFRRLFIRIVTVVKNHHLDSTEDGFHRIVIRTALGQTDPVELELPHGLPGCPALTGMGAILIHGDPDQWSGRPAAHVVQELPARGRPRARHTGPAQASGVHLIEPEQIEAAFDVLPPLQDPFFGTALAAPTIGLDRKRLDIKKDQPPLRGQLPPDKAAPA